MEDGRGEYIHSIDTGSVKRSQQMRGMNWGKGSWSYRRSDGRILEEISDRLCSHPHINASGMTVVVENGDVLLTGSVERNADKRLAGEIAGEVTGVVSVENRVHVTIPGVGK